MIWDNGKEGSESFYVLDEHDILSDDETAVEILHTTNSIESYINEKFYETLANRIKDEVKGAINTELNKNISLSHKVEPNDLNAATRNTKNDGNKSGTNDAWKDITIVSLKEINFLRNQVKQQNRIIELMTLKSNSNTEMSKINASKKITQKNESFNNQANTILNTDEVLSEAIGSELNERNGNGNISVWSIILSPR